MAGSPDEPKLRLQQYQADHPRGWFSDRRQKLDILASRLDEATQSVNRLAAKLLTLEGEAEKARLQIQTLSGPAARRNGIGIVWSSSTATLAATWMPGKATWNSPGTVPRKAGFGRQH